MFNRKKNTKRVLNKAIEIGFHAAGVVDLRKIDTEFEKYYFDWLQNGYHGEMAYMDKNAQQRFHPEMLVENAKSAIIVLASYNHNKPKLSSKYKISRYALGADYHFVVKQKLNELLEEVQTIITDVKGRAFVDSAPVPERYLALKAGLGFLGKNGMLIHPELGSFFFLGVLYLDKKLKLTDPVSIEVEKSSFSETPPTNKIPGIQENSYEDKIEKLPCCTMIAQTGFNEANAPKKEKFAECADCDLCMRACPNNAIIEPGLIDSNKCISYKTIEYKGEFTDNNSLAGYIFGCDICQQVCPYNKELKITGWPEFAPRKEIADLTDEDWQQMGSSQFKRLFSKTVLFRTGLKRLRRNIKHNNQRI